MKRGEIDSKLIQVRAVLINLERRMEKVKGIDLSKVMLEIEKAATHISAAIQELKKT